jgi:hypothetical protein
MLSSYLSPSCFLIALEKLVALGALSIRTEPTAGRPSTLWSLIAEDQQEDKQASPAENEEPEGAECESNRA